MVYSARGLAQTGLVSALAIGIVPLHASAQTESSDTEQVRTFETVTVTARRQEETLFTVPGQVSAFDADTLVQDLAAENIGALQGTVPNLNLVQGRGSSSSANIYIRGIGQPDALATFDPAVGVYVDDVYISRIRGALFDVYDVERIEVLRGPQGTLYGKNTNGGALKIVSKKPGDEFEAFGRLSYGSYNAIEAAGSISGPLIEDMLGGGFSLYRGSRDGYVEDPNGDFEYNDKDTWAARGTLVWTPTDPLEVVINADWTLKSITAHRDLEYDDFIDIDATPLELGDVFVGVEQDQTSQEFQLLYDGDGAISGVGGVFWLNENVSSFQQAYADDFLLFGGFPLAFTRDIEDNLNLHSYAAFGNLVYDVNDRLSVTGGLRYTYELKTYQRATSTTLVPTPFSFGVSESWEDVSPLVSVDYQFDDDLFGYAKVAKGFKSGGFNGRANAPGDETPYDPEIVWS